MIGHQDVTASRLSRITNCSYSLALAAFRPDCLLDIERAEALTEDGVAAFARKVEVVADADLARQIPHKYPATLDLFVNDTMSLRLPSPMPLGTPTGRSIWPRHERNSGG